MAEHHDLKLLERLRSKPQRRELQNAPKYDVAERPEQEPAPPRRRDGGARLYGSEPAQPLRNRVNAPHTLEVKVASVAVRAWVGGVGECGGEEAVGPVFGVVAGVGEDEVDFRVADLEPGELVGEPVAV